MVFHTDFKSVTKILIIFIKQNIRVEKSKIDNTSKSLSLTLINFLMQKSVLEVTCGVPNS